MSLRTMPYGSSWSPMFVQDAEEQDGHRLAEVQRLGGLAEDVLRIAQVRVQVDDDTLGTGQ